MLISDTTTWNLKYWLTKLHFTARPNQIILWTSWLSSVATVLLVFENQCFVNSVMPYNLFVYQSLSLLSCLSVSIKIHSVPAVGGEKYLELNCGQLQKLMTEGTFEICNVAKQSILLCALWLQSPGLGGHVREINQHFHLYFLEVL